jgi:hypothetical protein
MPAIAATRFYFGRCLPDERGLRVRSTLPCRDERTLDLGEVPGAGGHPDREGKEVTA